MPDYTTGQDTPLIRRGRSSYLSRQSPPVLKRGYPRAVLISDVHQPVLGPVKTTALPEAPVLPTAEITNMSQPPSSGSTRRRWRYRKPIAIAAIVISIAGASFSVPSFMRQDQPIVSSTQETTHGVAKEPVVASTQQYGLPVRLKIPRIKVDTVLEHKGLTDGGALDVPDGAQAAAWYNLGSRPGEIGSAIIDGHFGYENRRPAIFDFLHTLTPGDELYVEDEKGETIIFEVRKLETYGPDQRPGEVFESKDGKSHLNVITCAGSWDKKRQTYDKRLVVFSDKKIEPPSL